MSALKESQELEYSVDLSSPEATDSYSDEETAGSRLFDNLAETQELEYSINLSSEASSPVESESDEYEPTDLANLKGYDFEPVCEPRPVSPSSGEESGLDEKSRIGNTDWCKCGKCRPMETETESLCCQDTNEVPEEFFEGQ